MTGIGPTISQVECQDLDIDAACLNIPASTTAVDGRITDLQTRYRSTAQASSSKTNYGLAVTAVGAGWIADGVRCANTENASCVDDAGAANNGTMITDQVGTGAPPAELCDHARERGSRWVRTDGGNDQTVYDCLQVAGVIAWVPY